MDKDLNKKVFKLLKDAQPKTTEKGGINIHGDKNIIASRDVNIVRKQVIKNEIKYDPEKHISSKDAKTISDLIKILVKAEESAGMSRSKAYAKWYGKLKNLFSVNSYKEIPKKDADYAINWLKQQIAIERPKLKIRNKDEWKKQLYKAIYAKCRKIGWCKADLYQYISNRLNKKIISLKQLKNHELEWLYEYMKSKK
ncbi:ORF6C domain-containing protein [Desulfovulcanus sp.]